MNLHLFWRKSQQLKRGYYFIRVPHKWLIERFILIWKSKLYTIHLFEKKKHISFFS